MIGIIAAGLAAVLAVAVAAALGYRRLRQWRVARQLTITTPDGIVEELFVHIGGIEQWIGVRGESRQPGPARPAWRTRITVLDLHAVAAFLEAAFHRGPVGSPWCRQDVAAQRKGRQRADDIRAVGR